MTVEAIAAVLGGTKIIKSAPKTTADLVVLTRKGLPATTLSELAGDLKVDRKALGRVLGIPERTWMRRTASGGRLTVAESDRTLRFARVIAFAIDVLGTAETAYLVASLTASTAKPASKQTFTLALGRCDRCSARVQLNLLRTKV